MKLITMLFLQCFCHTQQEMIENVQFMILKGTYVGSCTLRCASIGRLFLVRPTWVFRICSTDFMSCGSLTQVLSKCFFDHFKTQKKNFVNLYCSNIVYPYITYIFFVLIITINLLIYCEKWQQYVGI